MALVFIGLWRLGFRIASIVSWRFVTHLQIYMYIIYICIYPSTNILDCMNYSKKKPNIDDNRCIKIFLMCLSVTSNLLHMMFLPLQDIDQ